MAKRKHRLKSNTIPALVMVGPVAALLILLVAIPLIYVAVMSFCKTDQYYNVEFSFSLDNYSKLFSPDYLTIYGQSLLIAILTTVISLLIGYPFAYIIARAKSKKKKALADFNNAIKDCKTQKEADAQALAEAKSTAKTELGNYKKDVVFADEDARAAEVTKGEEVIDDASTVKGVQRALADAKKAIDALKTKAEAETEAASEAAAQLAAAKNSASERLDDYSEAKALADATPEEKAAYDQAVADGKAAIAAAKNPAEVTEALTQAKAAVDAALATINADRTAAAEAAAEMAEADKAVEDAKTAAETAKKAAAEAVANEYATDADKTAVNTAKEALDAKIKAATDLPADATAQQKKDAAKAIEDAVKALNDKVDAANVNSAAAKAAAEAEADAAAQLATAKNSAKAAVNAALAKIDDDRAKAAEVTEMIDGLSATEDITVDDKDSIEAAREAYEALTEDQKAKVSEETLKKLEDAEATLEVVSKYSNEWVNGKWYNKDAKQNYLGIGKWHKNSKGWWFGDNLGWYAKNQWQKIDGKWYFFDKEGYMEANAYRQGYYLKANGAWDGKAKVAGWKQDSKGWWYSLGGNDFLKNGWKKIDGNWYYFKATGYIAINEFVQGWWLNKAGAWKDPVQCSWHKAGSKWWYGTKDGWYAKSKSYTIDGKKYTFDKKGYTK